MALKRRVCPPSKFCKARKDGAVVPNCMRNLHKLGCQILFEEEVHNSAGLTENLAFEDVWAGNFQSRCSKIQSVIETAASAASPMTKRQGSAWSMAHHRRWAGEAPLHFGHQGGCASSRLDQTLDVLVSPTIFSSMGLCFERVFN